MKTVRETTVWAEQSAINHIYFLSDDMSKMYAYARGDTLEVKHFSRPIGIETRGRKFAAVPNVYGFKVAEIEDSSPSWTVVGSKGDVYTIRLVNNDYTCTCSGFKFRHKCSHIDKVKNEASKNH
jgi:hypothetical protein